MLMRCSLRTSPVLMEGCWKSRAWCLRRISEGRLDSLVGRFFFLSMVSERERFSQEGCCSVKHHGGVHPLKGLLRKTGEVQMRPERPSFVY